MNYDTHNPILAATMIKYDGGGKNKELCKHSSDEDDATERIRGGEELEQKPEN